MLTKVDAQGACLRHGAIPFIFVTLVLSVATCLQDATMALIGAIGGALACLVVTGFGLPLAAISTLPWHP
eukprot:1508381-Amphidinium_carterae.1